MTQIRVEKHELSKRVEVYYAEFGKNDLHTMKVAIVGQMKHMRKAGFISSDSTALIAEDDDFIVILSGGNVLAASAKKGADEVVRKHVWALEAARKHFAMEYGHSLK